MHDCHAIQDLFRGHRRGPVPVSGTFYRVGVFFVCYRVLQVVDQIMPVAIYIPDSPPRPEAVL